MVEDVISAEMAAAIAAFAPQATVVGDGYGGKHRPLSPREFFSGATPVAATRWALAQPQEGGQRAQAVAWARSLIFAVKAAESAVRRIFEGSSRLLLDYSQLACRTHANDVSMSAAANGSLAGGSVDSHPPHADNCWLNGDRCIRTSPFFHWRSHSATLFLHDGASGFKGGSFFFTPSFQQASPRAPVLPRPGRMVAFTAGAENVHGVMEVLEGTRCAISVWLTDAPGRGSHAGELEAAERLLNASLV